MAFEWRDDAFRKLARGLLNDDAAYAKLQAMAAELERLTAESARIRAVVGEQANNEGLWFVAKYATEAYLQSELRRLHGVIEGKTGDECAREILASNRQESDSVPCAFCGDPETAKLSYKKRVAHANHCRGSHKCLGCENAECDDCA